jgi:hypothetical protein
VTLSAREVGVMMAISIDLGAPQPEPWQGASISLIFWIVFGVLVIGVISVLVFLHIKRRRHYPGVPIGRFEEDVFSEER